MAHQTQNLRYIDSNRVHTSWVRTVECFQGPPWKQCAKGHICSQIDTMGWDMWVPGGHPWWPPFQGFPTYQNTSWKHIMHIPHRSLRYLDFWLGQPKSLIFTHVTSSPMALGPPAYFTHVMCQNISLPNLFEGPRWVLGIVHSSGPCARSYGDFFCPKTLKLAM